MTKHEIKKRTRRAAKRWQNRGNTMIVKAIRTYSIRSINALETIDYYMSIFEDDKENGALDDDCIEIYETAIGRMIRAYIDAYALMTSVCRRALNELEAGIDTEKVRNVSRAMQQLRSAILDGENIFMKIDCLQSAIDYMDTETRALYLEFRARCADCRAQEEMEL